MDATEALKQLMEAAQQKILLQSGLDWQVYLACQQRSQDVGCL